MENNIDNQENKISQNLQNSQNLNSSNFSNNLMNESNQIKSKYRKIRNVKIPIYSRHSNYDQSISLEQLSPPKSFPLKNKYINESNNQLMNNPIYGTHNRNTSESSIQSNLTYKYHTNFESQSVNNPLYPKISPGTMCDLSNNSSFLSIARNNKSIKIKSPNTIDRLFSKRNNSFMNMSLNNTNNENRHSRCRKQLLSFGKCKFDVPRYNEFHNKLMSSMRQMQILKINSSFNYKGDELLNILNNNNNNKNKNIKNTKGVYDQYLNKGKNINIYKNFRIDNKSALQNSFENIRINSNKENFKNINNKRGYKEGKDNKDNKELYDEMDTKEMLDSMFTKVKQRYDMIHPIKNNFKFIENTKPLYLQNIDSIKGLLNSKPDILEINHEGQLPFIINDSTLISSLWKKSLKKFNVKNYDIDYIK